MIASVNVADGFWYWLTWLKARKTVVVVVVVVIVVVH